MHHGCVAGANEGGEGSGGVVADIAKLSVGREEYYTRELATDHEAVLVRPRRVPRPLVRRRRQQPRACRAKHRVAGFQAMFEGRHPDTGELLGRPHGRNAVPAFDVVLRPTKSVSILYGLGDPATGRAVLAAHHAGLAEAVAYLDEHLGARRGHGGVQHVSGQGLLAVGFDHRTSREGDPLLHTHLVVANRVQGPDGRWTALDGRDLYRHRLAADAIYRATYQRELVRTLGVEWTPADAHGNRELQGMPEELVAAVLQAHRPDRPGGGAAGSGRAGADTAAGQVGRPRHPQAQGARGTGHPVWTVADGGGRAGRGPGHPGPAGDRPDSQPRPGPDSVRAGRWPRCSTGWHVRTG